jgi:hypothetical protein
MFSFASYLQRPGFTEWFNRRDDYSTPQHIAAESSDQPTQSRPQPQSQEQRSETLASELLGDFDNGSEDESDGESDYESESVGPSLTCTSISY